MKFIVITLAVFSSVFAEAQEAPDPIRAEYFTCSLNEGKDMDDMMKWVEKWNRWMDATDETNYTAAMLFPRYRTPTTEFDMIWVGHVKNSEMLGKGNDNWLSASNRSLRESIPVTCDESFNAYQWVAVSNFSPKDLSDSYPVSYRYCDLKEGKNLGDAYAALSGIQEAHHASGMKSGARIIRPSNGAPSDLTKYDFVLSYANPTWADWGRLVDNYWGNLNGSDAANQVRETYSCEGSRMYAGTIIRNNN